MSLASLIPVQSRVSLALKTVGFSKDEKTAINSLIAKLANNGIADIVFPEKILTIEQLVESLLSKKAAGADISDDQLSFAHRVLGSEHGRSAVAQLTYKQLSLLPDSQRKHLATALTKLSDLPLYEKSDFTDEQDFIANGLLKTIDTRFIQPKLPNTDNETDSNMVMQCPRCNFVYIPTRYR